MQTFIVKQSARVASIAICSMLASCALPSSEAWRVIKQDGLIPYIALELGHKPDAPQDQNRYMESARPAAVVAGPPVAAAPAVAPSSLKTLPPRSAAANVPSPRVVLNNVPVYPPSAAPKTKPSEDKPTPKATASAASPKPATESKLPAPVPAKPKTETPKAPSVAEQKPKATPEKKPEPKTDSPATKDTAGTKPTATDGELPYGTPVPGRPGLVHSPYAGEKQLVDITGLKSGQEVKCPYSGKLFRVPPGAQAADTSSKDKK